MNSFRFDDRYPKVLGVSPNVVALGMMAGLATPQSNQFPRKPQASDLDAGWVDFRKRHRHIIATNSANRNSDSGSFAADDSFEFGQRTVPQCECIGSGEHPGYRSLGVPW